MGSGESWWASSRGHGASEGVRTVNTYHVAHDWIMANLPNGASVVVYSEDNQFLPRTDAQLAQCEVYAHSESAYREKWATNAAMISPGSGMPMRLAVVNDEFFHAFWCARERLTPGKLAFVGHRFHEGRRFQTLNVPTLEREFRAGLTDPGAGFDAVLVHWPLFADLPAAATFQTAVGPTLYAYLRPGLVLRYGAEP